MNVVASLETALRAILQLRKVRKTRGTSIAWKDESLRQMEFVSNQGTLLKVRELLQTNASSWIVVFAKGRVETHH